MAVSDTGATGNFLLPDTPVKNLRPETTPIKPTYQMGNKSVQHIRVKLIIQTYQWQQGNYTFYQGSAHTSLVSIKMLCDSGCAVTYDAEY